MKTYVLKKDLPTFRKGDRFEIKEDGCLWLVGDKSHKHWKQEVMAYHRRTLEKFPRILVDWFELEGRWYYSIYNHSVCHIHDEGDKADDFNKAIGNYFESEEEARHAIEKLKAWKRLEEQGFRFKTYQRNSQGTYDIYANWEGHMPPLSWMIDKDLDLLFSQENG